MTSAVVIIISQELDTMPTAARKFIRIAVSMQNVVYRPPTPKEYYWLIINTWRHRTSLGFLL